MAKPISTHPVEIHFAKISRYHYYIFFLLFLSKTPVFWHMINMLFLSPNMVYKCGDKGTKHNVKDACPCERPIWDKSVFTQTVQTKFNLICERKALVQVTTSILFVGTLLGAFAFGFLSDKYGRLKMFCVSVGLMAAFGSLLSLMPNIGLYILMRCLEGISVGGAIVTGYVLCVEYCGIAQRETVSALYHIPLNIGHMTLAGVSYLLRDMDHYILATSLPLILFVIMYFICFESPKWLMDNNEIDKAADVMNKIAKFNKTSYGDIKAEMLAYKATHSTPGTAREGFMDIFKYKPMIKNFICMGFIYFVCGMGFYGVTQYIGNMSGNIHANVAMSGIMLIPATLSCVFLLHVLSRKTFLIITSVASGVFMLIVVLVIPESMNLARVITASLSNCFFFMSFIVVFLYGVELFPTSVRNTVLGVLSVMSRSGQIIAPFINYLPQKVSGCIFGVLALAGGVICLPLPETKNKELPSSMAAYASAASEPAPPPEAPAK